MNYPAGNHSVLIWYLHDIFVVTIITEGIYDSNRNAILLYPRVLHWFAKFCYLVKVLFSLDLYFMT